jgi:hypothetical protein
MNSLQNTNFCRTVDISLIGFVWNKVAPGSMTFFYCSMRTSRELEISRLLLSIIIPGTVYQLEDLTWCREVITTYWNTVLIVLNSEQTTKGLQRKNLFNLPVTFTGNATKKQIFSLKIFGITADLVHSHTYLAISNNIPISSYFYLSALMMIW